MALRVVDCPSGNKFCNAAKGGMQYGAFFPPPPKYRAAGEESWYMPPMAHITVNTVRRETLLMYAVSDSD